MSERERQGAATLAAVMRRAGKPGREIAVALQRAARFGVLEAMADVARPESLPELRVNYAYRAGRDAEEAERERNRLDRLYRGSPGEVSPEVAARLPPPRRRARKPVNGTPPPDSPAPVYVARATPEREERTIPGAGAGAVRRHRCGYLRGSTGCEVTCGG